MEITLYILIVNLLLAFKLFNDKRLKNKGKTVNHKLSALIDGIIYLISGYFSFSFSVLLAGWFIISIGYRWLMFDGIFNLINKWHIFNCGDTSLIDVKTDLIDGKDDNRCAWTLPVKIGIIIIGILIIIYG